MKLPANHPMFRSGLDGQFFSPFPSEDAEADSKFKALKQRLNDRGQSAGDAAYSAAVAEAITDASQMMLYQIATKVGDIRTDWIDSLAWEETKLGADVWQGYFSNIAIPASTDPEDLFGALANVGFSVASNFISAVPIAGWIIGAAMNLGRFLFQLFNQETPAEQKKKLPWRQYSRSTDEDIINTFVKMIMQSVDHTQLWEPPFEVKQWAMASAEYGASYIPLSNGEPAYTSGLGCMPGTQRVMDRIQIRSLSPESNNGRNGLFWFRSGELAVVRRDITDCGTYFPSLANFGTVAWSQAARVGSPNMYKIDTVRLHSLWRDTFENIFNDFYTRFAKGDDVVSESYALTRWVVQNGHIGVSDLDRSVLKGSYWFHPEIWTKGPVVPSRRISPWTPGGNHAVNDKSACPVVSNDGPSEYYGGNCFVWPHGAETISEYAPVHKAIILPAIDRLQVLQRRSLSRSLVCAYVRPVEVDGKPPYAAFSKNSQLRDYCIECRKELLKRSARFRVNLADVQEIDRDFATALKEAGVTGTPADYSKSLGFKGVGDSAPDSEPGRKPLVYSDEPPDPLPPMGGSPAPDSPGIVPDRSVLADVARFTAPWLLTAAVGTLLFKGQR